MRFFLLSILILFFSCNNSQEETINDSIPESESKWSVDEDNIKGGGKTYELSKTPKFGTVNDFLRLSDHEKVALVSFKNEVRVYPYFFTNHFEVINDSFNDLNIAVTYCPLTKSGICYDREIDNKTYELLASGYLYKDNMVPSDKNQELLWSQMLMSVIGKNNAGKKMNNYNLIETNWKTVKTYFSDAKVYYHEKRDANPTDPNLNETGDAAYIYGVFNEKIETEVNLFKYDIFKDKTKLTNKVFNNRNVIVIGSKEKYFVTSYYTKDNLSFSLLDDSEFPNIIKDNEGNIWNVFGYAISGNRKGEQLDSPKAYVAQYWAWKDFFTNLKFN